MTEVENSEHAKLLFCWGRGGGQVVSMLSFYSDVQCSNPADIYSFSVKFVFEKNKNKQKEAGVGSFF